MQPLSKTTRLTYLFGLIILFFLLLPLVIFFANGYRFKSGIGIVKTGGIYLSVPYSDATVFFDDEEIGASSFLNRSFYFEDLTPGAYTVRVVRSDFREWSRTLVVEQQLVTDAEALLLPSEFEFRELVVGTSTTATSTSISAQQYAEYESVFERSAATTSASSVAGELVVIENGDVVVRWTGEQSLPPSRFCGRPSYCVMEISIERDSAIATTSIFYGGGVLFATTEGVFFSEVDIRPTHNRVPIYPKSGANFRIVNGSVVIKDGKKFYELAGL